MLPSKNKATNIAVGMSPKPGKGGPTMAAQTPQPYLSPAKRGDNGLGPLPKTACGDSRNVALEGKG